MALKSRDRPFAKTMREQEHKIVIDQIAIENAPIISG
jgi:hypothetical protein